MTKNETDRQNQDLSVDLKKWKSHLQRKNIKEVSSLNRYSQEIAQDMTLYVADRLLYLLTNLQRQHDELSKQSKRQKKKRARSIKIDTSKSRSPEVSDGNF